MRYISATLFLLLTAAGFVFAQPAAVVKLNLREAEDLALKNHPQVQIFTYPGRDHAFARKGGEHYDAADAALAGQRTLDFFKKALR